MPFTRDISSATTKGTNNWLSAASVAAQNAAIISPSSGWGASLPTGGGGGGAGVIAPTSIAPTKMLADYVKESAAWQTGSSFNTSTTNHTTNATSSMLWAAAVKAPSLIEQQQQQQQHHHHHHQQQQQQHHHHHHHQSQHVSSASASSSSISSSANPMLAVQCAFESNSTMGSWNSPDTSSSNRGGWNADGSSRNNGVFDDGTAIWGNPSTKKTGIDWTEKESSLNPQQANNNNNSNSNSEKRIQKSEPVISSLNGTEAWGAPTGNGNGIGNASASLAFKQPHILPNNNSNSQQQLNLNDNGGNNYGSKAAANETLSWGELSSLQQATKNENSSPPNSSSVWNTSPTTPSNNDQMNDLVGKYEQSNPLPASNNPQSQLNSNAYTLGVTPSRDLLKQMVHQIQLAVQAGHLNAHILNQPMSTPSLQLVYTLLQQIKLLQQFQEIQQRSLNDSSDLNSPSNLDLQISRVQQNISLLQKAITQQQAALTKNQTIIDSNLKQQQQQQQQQQQEGSGFSYANISKLSTSTKVPSSNYMSIINNNSNLESFSRSSLIDTIGNSDSDSLRTAQTDPIGFMRSNNSSGNIQRSPSTALYDWSEFASLQFNPDENNIVQTKRTTSSSGGCSSSSSIGSGSRPAPPPGLMNNTTFGSIIGSNNSSVNGLINSNSGSQLGSSNESHLPSRESSSSLWSGTWYD